MFEEQNKSRVWKWPENKNGWKHRYLFFTFEIPYFYLNNTLLALEFIVRIKSNFYRPSCIRISNKKQIEVGKSFHSTFLTNLDLVVQRIVPPALIRLHLVPLWVKIASSKFQLSFGRIVNNGDLCWHSEVDLWRL
jgi:hypothetical protein